MLVAKNQKFVGLAWNPACRVKIRIRVKFYAKGLLLLFGHSWIQVEIRFRIEVSIKCLLQ